MKQSGETKNRQALAALFKRAGRPLGFKEVLLDLGLARPEGRALRALLRDMVRDGEIFRTRRGFYGPAEEMSLVTGLFQAHRNGFGFVVPEAEGEADMFVPPRKTMGAMEGDRVVARLHDPQRREGRIVKILQRGLKKVVGRVVFSRGAWFLRPRGRASGTDLFIDPSKADPSKADPSKADPGKADPGKAGPGKADPGKAGPGKAEPGKAGGAKQGDLVVAEITAYPSESEPASCRVLKVLGEPEGPLDEVEAVIEEFSLPKRFPPDVRQEALALRKKNFLGDGRKDLRGLLTVTIDGESARDFDDAISVKRTKQGYALYVHIADVGFFVPWDSLLDLEARRRGTSVYFPDRVIPMLPKELSEDLCSLKPGLDRAAFTCQMHFDLEGKRTRAMFYPSLIKSDQRMTYTLVKEIVIEKDEAQRNRHSPLLSDFDLMAELAALLRGVRLKRGSLDFDLPEPEVVLNAQGLPEDILKAERNFAHMMIEEFMVAANEAVAERLEGLSVPGIYRVHEPPDPVKTEEMLTLLRPLLNEASPVRRRHRAHRFSRKGILKGAGSGPGKRGKKLAPVSIPRLIEKIKGTPLEEVAALIILRSLKQAKYSTRNLGHFGLASKCYTHFTSPIRRYPDLVVHRILRETLGRGRVTAKRASELKESLPDLASGSSARERLADEAEKEVMAVMRAWLMKGKLGRKFKGTVVTLTPRGMRVRLRDYFVEGFVHVSGLTDDFYRMEEETATLRGRRTGRTFRLGQELTVVVEKVDTEQREIRFGAVA